MYNDFQPTSTVAEAGMVQDVSARKQREIERCVKLDWRDEVTASGPPEAIVRIFTTCVVLRCLAICQRSYPQCCGTHADACEHVCTHVDAALSYQLDGSEDVGATPTITFVGRESSSSSCGGAASADCDTLTTKASSTCGSSAQREAPL